MANLNIAHGHGTIYKGSLKLILSYINDISNKTFCDLGSGKGDVLYDIINDFNFLSVTGIEYETLYFNISKKKLLTVIKDNININLINDDFFNVNFSNYDVLFMYSTHYTIIFPKLIVKMENELKNGSYVIVCSVHKIKNKNFSIIKQFSFLAIGASSGTLYKFIK